MAMWPMPRLTAMLSVVIPLFFTRCATTDRAGELPLTDLLGGPPVNPKSVQRKEHGWLAAGWRCWLLAGGWLALKDFR